MRTAAHAWLRRRTRHRGGDFQAAARSRCGASTAFPLGALSGQTWRDAPLSLRRGNSCCYACTRGRQQLEPERAAAIHTKNANIRSLPASVAACGARGPDVGCARPASRAVPSLDAEDLLPQRATCGINCHNCSANFGRCLCTRVDSARSRQSARRAGASRAAAVWGAPGLHVCVNVPPHSHGEQIENPSGLHCSSVIRDGRSPRAGGPPALADPK